MNPLPKHRVLAFGCHPGDVEFMCAGTLALLAKPGCEIHIALMAGERFGMDQSYDDHPLLELAFTDPNQVHEIEARAALSESARTEAFNLLPRGDRQRQSRSYRTGVERPLLKT